MKPYALTAILLTALAHAQKSSPTVIYIHGNILTGTHLRANDPSATPAKVTALAIADGKILAAGTDADILKTKTHETKIIDLNGAFAMPGFNDAHTHMAAAGQQQLSINLDGVKSLAEMQQRITVASLKSLHSNGYEEYLVRMRALSNSPFSKVPPLQSDVNGNISDVYRNLDRT